MEKVCRDCWEKQYADSSTRRWKLSDLLYVLVGVAVVIAIFSFEWVRFEWIRKPLDLFGVMLLTTKLILAAGIIAGGLWDSLRARSWKILLLWMVPVPAVIGLAFWKITGNGAWQITFWAGAALIGLYRFSVRVREWRF
jgi:hypothetical protein